jgi:hypothetical protein
MRLRSWTLGAFILAVASAAAIEMTPLPEMTEVWSPEPPVVRPGTSDAAPPADAILLLANGDQAAWESVRGGPARWRAEQGALFVAPGAGDIRTREAFGDVQLHVEWRTPILPPSVSGQERGNSGIFLQERYEVQVLDSFEHRTYVNGQAGAIYKQHAPLVNASRPSGEWQSYDIVFIAPRFGSDGSLAQPARMTVFHNGVLIHHDAVLRGATVWRGEPSYEPHGDAPIRLQDHGSEVSFRNIWVHRL